MEVTSLTIGIGSARGLFLPVVPRNSTIPTRRTARLRYDAALDAFVPASLAADAADARNYEASPSAAEATSPVARPELRRLRVFVGERARAEDNRLLGAVDVGARDGETVELVFDLDANTILRVHDAAFQWPLDLRMAEVEAHLLEVEANSDADRAYRLAALGEVGWDEESFLRSAVRLHVARWSPQGTPDDTGPTIDELD